MSKKIPMLFSIRSAPVPQPNPEPVPVPVPVPAPTPQTTSSRFTMHDLYKVAKKGCKSCGG